VGFSVFLPDTYFANVWKLARLIISHPDLSYLLNFSFDGFMPRKLPERPDLISYEEWLAGRPCLSTEHFAFTLGPSKKENLEPSKKENYSFDPTATGI
jgi:hypothetical protein